MGEIRLGPIEWGVVTAHHPWGMGVRLEESGDEGVDHRSMWATASSRSFSCGFRAVYQHGF